MTTKPFSFSFSALSTYEACGKKYYHLYDAKDVKDEDSAASAEGKVWHEAMKNRVINNKPLPPDLRHMEKLAARLAGLPGQKFGELKLAINRQMQPCAWFGADTYIRCIVDLLIVHGTTGIIIDWKFGKRKDDFTQMGLNAAVLSKVMPELDLFKTILAWVNDKPDAKNYTLSKLDEVWANILPRADKIEVAKKAGLASGYVAKPSGLCRGWCPVKHCQYFRDR